MIRAPLPPSVAIIMINFNRVDDTIECIRSLQRCEYPAFSILLIDNGSTDGSEARLRSELPDIPLLAAGENLGYTGGVNLGLEQHSSKEADYVLILNNDTIVEPDFLDHLVAAMEEQQHAAAACGTIYCHHDREKIWYAGGRLIPWRGIAVHEHKGQKLPRVGLNGVRSVSFVTGCMIILRTSMLADIGKEDERFFMYLDDIEFSARIMRKGYRLLYVPQSVIYHKVLGEKESPFKLYYSARNRLLLIQTLGGRFERTIAAMYFLTVISLKYLAWSVVKPPFARAAFAGLRDYFGARFYEGRGATFVSP
ncbi:MAG: glycosyltransferase family 2 protein [Bacteroidota bacterium]